MFMLILSAVFFTALHLGVAGTRLRDGLVARLGPTPYMLMFSVGSLFGIFWLVRSYQASPYVETWGQLEWWKPAAIALMLPAFLLAVIGVTTPNPTAVGQEAGLAQSPQGIVKITRHPFLVGVGLWALVHLIGNGDLASLILFGTFAAVCGFGTMSIDAKRLRLLGSDAWGPFAARTSILPFAAVAAGRSTLNAGDVVTWRAGAGLLAYALMLGGHSHLIGVSPFPT
ncbi:NnrU family protein [Lichenifustis flavocetrariae]|uniref:NnrU family protein n=1 Tax=Lichenifustis flavocetrariae TaxID=2949735 RepID=A0AA41Z586_9HYPH|nr:NnrU family protein [Lichenifustis flavocetrariae]MCW6509522.1 NnrU family protein [Lichenifustis flavocetrariae]